MWSSNVRLCWTPEFFEEFLQSVMYIQWYHWYAQTYSRYCSAFSYSLVHFTTNLHAAIIRLFHNVYMIMVFNTYKFSFVYRFYICICVRDVRQKTSLFARKRQRPSFLANFHDPKDPEVCSSSALLAAYRLYIVVNIPLNIWYLAGIIIF